jgi:hypothetical protein
MSKAAIDLFRNAPVKIISFLNAALPLPHGRGS